MCLAIPAEVISIDGDNAQVSLGGVKKEVSLALVDDVPRTLSLKQALRVFLDHRLEVVKRRSEFDLARASASADSRGTKQCQILPVLC